MKANTMQAHLSAAGVVPEDFEASANNRSKKEIWESLLKERDFLRIELAKGSRRPQQQVQADLTIVKSKIKTFQRDLENDAQKEKHRVSDHALVRYLERVQGIDVGRLKDLIFERHCATQIEDGGRFIASAGHVFVVSPDRIIVTVISQHEA